LHKSTGALFNFVGKLVLRQIFKTWLLPWEIPYWWSACPSSQYLLRRYKLVRVCREK